MNWALIFFPIWFPLLYTGLLVLLISIFDRARCEAERQREEAFRKAEEVRKANRTPKQVDNDARGACVAMCGFDPGPAENLKG